jgi:hypothetical protein
LSGGGIVGVYSDTGTATMYTVADNSFTNLSVNTTDYIQGGGVIGVRSNFAAAIQNLDRNIFMGNNITAGTYIDGGGIIGVTGVSGSTALGYGLGRITDSLFTGNNITANNGQIMGGLVYSYGIVDGMTISNSQFLDNTFTSNKVYGTIAIDTGVPNVPPNEPYALTLQATNGNNTVFRNNRIIEGGNDPRTNSLYFGTIDHLSAILDSSKTDATLIVDAQSGGSIYLYDPIEVNQDSDKNFNMEVRGNGGDFYWGGDNKFALGGISPAHGNVQLLSGSKTTLLEHMSLDAPNHEFNLGQGGLLTVMGRDEMSLDKAFLDGRVNFELSGTTLNQVSDAMLKMHVSPNNLTLGPNMTASLGDFPAGSPLRLGDQFYLIDADNNLLFDGTSSNKHAYARQGYLAGYNFITDRHDLGMAPDSQYFVARLPYAAVPGDPAPIVAAHETRVITHSRAAGMEFISGRASWLPDHSYQSANILDGGVTSGDKVALAEDDFMARMADLGLIHSYLPIERGDITSGNGTVRVEGWEPFAGIDGAWVRVEDGPSSFDLDSVNLMAGFVRKSWKTDSSFQMAGFLEVSHGEYTTHDDFPYIDVVHNVEHIRGDGDLDSYGAGIMARKVWNNGTRLEGSFRIGRLKNSFYSGDYLEGGTNVPIDYDIKNLYMAAHVGIGHTWNFSDRNSLDVLARYYWARQNSDNVTLPSGEVANFDSDDSHRARIGARFTHRYNERNSWYVGLAAEHDFDGVSEGGFQFDGQTYLTFGNPDFSGTTGIAEIGLLIPPAPGRSYSIEAGVEGYFGNLRGWSGGLRFEWEL